VDRNIPVRKTYACKCQISSKIRAHIPKQFQEVNLTDLGYSKLELIEKWFQVSDPGMFISGVAGVGKTHIACAIIRALIVVGQEVRFAEAADFYRELRMSFNTDASEVGIVEKYATVQWLALDDFGAGAISDFERRYALELLNLRMANNRRTIVTSNLDLEQIREVMDERLCSRLSSFTQLRLTGRDRRKQ